jgi:hypothetical protein
MNEKNLKNLLISMTGLLASLADLQLRQQDQIAALTAALQMGQTAGLDSLRQAQEQAVVMQRALRAEIRELHDIVNLVKQVKNPPKRTRPN